MWFFSVHIYAFFLKKYVSSFQSPIHTHTHTMSSHMLSVAISDFWFLYSTVCYTFFHMIYKFVFLTLSCCSYFISSIKNKWPSDSSKVENYLSFILKGILHCGLPMKSEMWNSLKDIYSSWHVSVLYLCVILDSW